QPLLPRTQKRQELSANIRSTCTKQSTHAATVQNVDPTAASAVYEAKRLVYHDRLKRRIFPRSDPPQTSEISEVCVRRNSVPIQSTPIRPISSAEGIHKVHRSSHRSVTSTRLTRIQLFGRLVNCFSFKGCSSAGRPSSGGAPVSTGLCNKQGKKRSMPKANYAFPRHGSRLHLHGVSRTNKCHQIMRAPVPTGTVSLVAVLPTPVGNDGVGRYRAPTGDVAYAAVPDMVPVSEAQRRHRQTPQGNGVLQMQEGPDNLESPLVSRCVRHYGHSDASRSSNYRRLHQGVGSGLRRERRERSLVCDRGRVSYKCVRTADSSPGSTTLSAQTEWSACVSEDGQHCGLGVYKPSRRSAL